MDPRMASALLRYRVMAYIVGVMLLILVTAMILKYGFGYADATRYVAVMHGWLYMIYIICAIDLGLRARWSFPRMALVVVAGTIPLLSFVAERRVVGWVRAEQLA